MLHKFYIQKFWKAYKSINYDWGNIINSKKHLLTYLYEMLHIVTVIYIRIYRYVFLETFDTPYL